MWLNMFISAIIGIVSFSLIFTRDNTSYYQAPMGIIGKVYANSMLVLVNSRMVLGSEETQTPSTVISVLRFCTTPTDSTIEADNGNVGVDTKAAAGLSKSSEPEEFKLSEK